jgi:hypothetical protein
MLLKNTIARNWHIPMNKAKTLAAEDKSSTMQFLVAKVYYAPDSDLQLQSYLHMSLLAVAKTELEHWGLLHDLLVASLCPEVSEQVLRLTYDILKQQMKKRMTRQKLVFKALSLKLLQPLLSLAGRGQHVLIDKLLLVLMTADPDLAILNSLIAKANSLIAVGDYARALELVKGLSIVSHVCPLVSVDLARVFYSIIVQVAADTELCLRLLSRTAKALNVLLKTTSEAEMSAAELQPLFERVLRLLSVGEQWDIWMQGDFEGFILQDEPPEDSDEFGGLLHTLMALYPRPIEGFMSQLLAGLTGYDVELQHSILTASGILPSSFSDEVSSVVTLSSVLAAVQTLNVEGFGLQIILKDTAWLLRKWLAVEQDSEVLVNCLCALRAKTEDPIVRYECCLTAKQILYSRATEALTELLLTHFAGDVISIMQRVSAPKVIWHLVNLTSLLVHDQGFSEADLSGLSAAGNEVLSNGHSEAVILNAKRTCEGLLLSAVNS